MRDDNQNEIGELLKAGFFRHCVDEVAKTLIGCYLFSEETDGRVGGQIIETEAYCQNDPAAHCHAKANPERLRNSSPMFLGGGHVYLYPSRLRDRNGLWCLNFTCGQTDFGSAVLIRALLPTEGKPTMRKRRGDYEKRALTDDRLLCNGPGKLWEALDVGDDNGRRLTDTQLRLYKGLDTNTQIVCGVRILGRLNQKSSSFEAKDWPRRYALSTVVINPKLCGFLSSPMKDAVEYSPALLQELKRNGPLADCGCM